MRPIAHAVQYTQPTQNFAAPQQQRAKADQAVEPFEAICGRLFLSNEQNWADEKTMIGKKNLARLASLCLGSVMCVGCAAEAPEAPPSGSVYHSMNGGYTCRVPPLIRPGATEKEGAAGDNDFVSFMDDYGTLLRIESERVAPEDWGILTGPKQQELLAKLFDHELMPRLFFVVSPNTTVLRRDEVDTAAGKAFFAVVNIPGGSTLMESGSSNWAWHRLDSMRGVLIFPKQNFLYIVMNQEWPMVVEMGKHSLPDRTNQLLADLRKTVEGMTFQTNGHEMPSYVHASGM